jgi:long-chain acyl-CoA synthetase
MSPMAEKLRFIMAIDPARAQIDFDSEDYDWGQIAATVTGIGARLPRRSRGLRLRLPR